MKGLISMTALAILVQLAAPALAAPPARLHYQGFLTDKEGTPVEGEWVASFRLFITENGAIPFFEETRTVTPDVGVFSVVLGGEEGNPLPTEQFEGGEVWLGVEISGTDGPVELEPRQRVVSHPYAFFAGQAQVCDQAANSLALGGTSAGSFVTLTQLGDLCIALEDVPALVEEYGITDEELPVLLESLGYSPGAGLDLAALEQWLLDNGYLPGPYYADEGVAAYLDVNGYLPGPYYSDDNLAAYLALNGYHACVCYDDGNVQAYLDVAGYATADLNLLKDGTTALEGNWDVGGFQLLNLVIHNAPTDSPPDGSGAGQLWWDTTLSQLKVYDGDVWVPVKAEAGVAVDLACEECVGDNEVSFDWAMGETPGGAAVSALSLDCIECIENDQLAVSYAGGESKGGAALSALDLACDGCVSAEEAGFNWAIASLPGGIALMAEQAVNADTLDNKEATDFEPAGAVATHEDANPHLTQEQHQGLTGGGETALHTHPGSGAESGGSAQVRMSKGDHNLPPNGTVHDYIHVFSSDAPKLYIYLYGDVPEALLLPNHTHGSHSHNYNWCKGYSSGCINQSGSTNGSTVGSGNYPLTNINNNSVPTKVQIWVDGENVTAALGDPNQKGAPEYDAATNTWGGSTNAWKSGRLDLSNVVDWGVGEHTLEFKETGNTGGRLLYYLYIVHPAAQSTPLSNDSCQGAMPIELNNGTATIEATTEDMLGENKAVDDLSPDACGGSGGGDVVYSLEIAQRSVVTASVQGAFEPRLYILSAPCEGETTVGCGTSTFETDELDPGTYYVVVDSDDPEQTGDFILTVEVTSAPLPDNDACAEAILIDAGAGPTTVQGTTLYGIDQYGGTCGGEGGADVVYELEATNLNDDLTATITAGFASRLYLRAEDCEAGFQLSCSTNGTLSINGLTPGIYYLFVDGQSKPDEGTFSMVVSLN
jgi:hypothetical protein